MRLRTFLLGLAACRAVLAIVAIPLAPFLYREHFVIVVLLRPTKEVLLAAGFLISKGDVSLLPVLVASVPLVVLGVWHFYALGRMYQDEIRDANLPGIAGRLLPSKRICDLADAVDDEGVQLVVLGRLAAFPSTLVGAGAGVSGIEPRRFLPADGLGALLSVAEAVGAGYFLGDAYERAGPWLTVVGFVVLVAFVVLLGRRLLGSGAKESARSKLTELRRVRREQGVRAALSALK